MNKKEMNKEEEKIYLKLQKIAEVEKMSVEQRKDFFEALNDYIEINIEISKFDK